MSDKTQLIQKLIIAQSGACNCLTKTPEVSWHETSCRYRVLAEAADELRAVLAQEAGPVVERQGYGYVLAKQTAVEVPGQERKELGYTLFDGIGVFHTREEVHAAIAELGLPIGWVSMTVDQLLPGYMMPEDTSPPAPVAVVLPEREHVHSKTLPFRHPAIGDGYISGWNACLDKVKEMNQ
jgi:hypothetical protein